MASRRADERVPVVVGKQGRVTIPGVIRRELEIAEGDVLLSQVTEHGTLELVPASRVSQDQAWFFSEPVQARIAEAEADVAAGRTTTVCSVEEAIEHLDRLGK